MKRIMAACLLACVALQAGAEGADFHVSPSGNDGWSGKLAQPNKSATDGPFRTLSKAAEVLRAGDTCHVGAGTYRQTLRPVRSGQKGRPITFRASAGQKPIISGADLLTDWKPDKGKIYKSPMAWDLADQNQVFVDGKMVTEARWPNSDDALLKPKRAVVQSGTASTITDPRLPGDDDFWKGAMLWCGGGSRWICWAAKVTGYDSKRKTLTFAGPQAHPWYRPRKGNPYVLMGIRAALDAEGQWWYDRDSSRMHLWAPDGQAPTTLTVEAKRRIHAIDLSGRSHIQIIGLHFRAGGILTDEKTSDVLLKNLRGEYIGHSYVRDISAEASVLIVGRNIEINSCEFSRSSGSIVRIEGSDNKLINCLIYEGNYGAKWKGAVSFAGRRHLISHNTIRDSGRDLVTIHGLMESIIEFNDLSNAGWLTQDLGMIYGHNTDFMNTVIRYNRVHDNLAKGHTAGIYFDHLSHNVIVHHNVIWNVPGNPIQINNPSYFNLVYNNTCWRTRNFTTFDHSHRNDLFGTRLHNNIFNAQIRLPDHVAKDHNLIQKDPPLAAPSSARFTLKPGSGAIDAGVVLRGITGKHEGKAPDLGAYEHGREEWKTGHDFENPPKPVWRMGEVAFMNGIRNACFEPKTLESWTKTGSGTAELTKGNGWGNGFGKGKVEKTGTSARELRLSGGRCGVEQTVAGLHPNTRYTLSGWLRASDGKETAGIGVRNYGGKELVATSRSKEWTRKTVEFTTGKTNTTATVFLGKMSDGPGFVFCDNTGLPRIPPTD